MFAIGLCNGDYTYIAFDYLKPKVVLAPLAMMDRIAFVASAFCLHGNCVTHLMKLVYHDDIPTGVAYDRSMSVVPFFKDLYSAYKYDRLVEMIRAVPEYRDCVKLQAEVCETLFLVMQLPAVKREFVASCCKDAEDYMAFIDYIDSVRKRLLSGSDVVCLEKGAGVLRADYEKRYKKLKELFVEVVESWVDEPRAKKYLLMVLDLQELA